jgi:hypothetical protein
MGADLRPLLVNPTTRGVHHLALCTDDMKATIDFISTCWACRSSMQ